MPICPILKSSEVLTTRGWQNQMLSPRSCTSFTDDGEICFINQSCHKMNGVRQNFFPILISKTFHFYQLTMMSWTVCANVRWEWRLIAIMASRLLPDFQEMEKYTLDSTSFSKLRWEVSTVMQCYPRIWGWGCVEGTLHPEHHAGIGFFGLFFYFLL